MKKIILIISSAICLSSPTLTADQDLDKTLAPYFDLEGVSENSLETFPLKSTHAEVKITDTIAAVQLTQTYANTGSKPINATYLFPASTKAAVHGMTMTIGERRIRAQIQEKKEALKTFEKAKAAGKAASLLAQERPNIFQMSVANILPGEEVTVMLQYSEQLSAKDSLYEFVFPTVVGPRYQSGSSTTEISNPHLHEGSPPLSPSPPTFTFDLKINTSLPLKSLACHTHPTTINFTSKSAAQVTLVPDRTDASSGTNGDLILSYQLAGKEILSGLLLHEESKDDGYFLLNVQPPAQVTAAHIPPRDYVFVIDVSGSMRGFPLTVSKELFTKLAKDLRPVDSFNILLFAGSSKTLAAQPLLATPRNVTKAIEFLNNTQGGGGTELIDALEKGINLPGHEDRSRSLIVITDGFISMEAEAFELVKNKLGQANLFAFGIGSSVNRHLIEGLARLGHGEPFVVTRLSEARPVADELRAMISSPVLTNITVSTEGFTTQDLEPSFFPDVFAKRPLTISGKWTGEAQGSVTVTGLTGGGDTFTQTFQVAEAAERGSLQNPPLRTLWAREKVRALADYAALSNNADTISEVTQLGLEYALLTPYTSFVAVDDATRERNASLGSTDVEQSLPLAKGVSTQALLNNSNSVGGGSVPEPSGILLIFISGLGLLMVRARA